MMNAFLILNMGDFEGDFLFSSDFFVDRFPLVPGGSPDLEIFIQLIRLKVFSKSRLPLESFHTTPLRNLNVFVPDTCTCPLRRNHVVDHERVKLPTHPSCVEH